MQAHPMHARSLDGAVCENCGHPLPAAEDEVLEFGDLRLDVATHAVYVRGHLVDWPPGIGKARPTALLALLMRSPGRAWRRDSLMTALGMWDARPATMSVHAHRLRRALQGSAVRLQTIRATHGGGGCDGAYMLVGVG